MGRMRKKKVGENLLTKCMETGGGSRTSDRHRKAVKRNSPFVREPEKVKKGLGGKV